MLWSVSDQVVFDQPTGLIFDRANKEHKKQCNLYKNVK